jgi:hypothetical protein
MTGAAMSPSPVPLRRIPAPMWEPPFDDEVGRSPAAASRGPASQGTLALAFMLPNDVPAVPVPTVPALGRGLRLVGSPDADETADAVEFGPQPTPRAQLPEPRRWAARFVQAVVEVLAGDRPTGQLVRWTTTEVFDEVAARVAPPRHRNRPGAGTRGIVRSVHVTEPADGVAEVAALVRRGLRSTAIALRLEGMDGRWQCTAIELG